MKVIRLDRFSVDPANAEEMLAKREQLVAAVRNAVPGLIEARLTRIDDRQWLDMWRWESRAHAEAAIKQARSGAIPQAPAAFSLTADHRIEIVDIIDER